MVQTEDGGPGSVLQFAFSLMNGRVMVPTDRERIQCLDKTKE